MQCCFSLPKVDCGEDLFAGFDPQEAHKPAGKNLFEFFKQNLASETKLKKVSGCHVLITLLAHWKRGENIALLVYQYAVICI